jgi:tRNA(fMet)-specific endonuclease VapC
VKGLITVTGNFLLDTNIVIGLFNGDVEISKWLADAVDVYICNVVIGELYYGAFKSTRKKENIEKLEDFIVSSSILESDISTAREYGVIKNELRQKGKPIPENDIWIAAFAKQFSLTLFTADAHFKEISSIKVIIHKS